MLMIVSYHVIHDRFSESKKLQNPISAISSTDRITK